MCCKLTKIWKKKEKKNTNVATLWAGWEGAFGRWGLWSFGRPSCHRGHLAERSRGEPREKHRKRCDVHSTVYLKLVLAWRPFSSALRNPNPPLFLIKLRKLRFCALHTSGNWIFIIMAMPWRWLRVDGRQPRVQGKVQGIVDQQVVRRPRMEKFVMLIEGF